MYEIRPETIMTFITDRNVKLPRFQRKQTWDDKKNFQLCISVFKEYPIGVCILSVDESKGKGKSIRWLLDGRQRKNALSLMYKDPENIYIWAKRYIGFKNSDQPDELAEKFWEKINEYLEAEEDEEEQTKDINDASLDATDLEDIVDEEDDVEIDNSIGDDGDASGLDLLLEIILAIHNKTKKGSGFTKPFDFTKYIDKLHYVENVDGDKIISSRLLKEFIDGYVENCDSHDLEIESEENFYNYLSTRFVVNNEKGAKQLIKKNWQKIIDRISLIERIENVLRTGAIGLIETKNLSPSDAQKIFNIINSEGEKLTAVEILSAKPKWNIPVAAPSKPAIEAKDELYKRIGTVPSNVVRWDLPATIVRRIGRNIILKQFSDSKTDFSNELTLGFKLLAGVYVESVNKEAIEALSNASSIDWDTDVDQFIIDIINMHKILCSFDYFKFMKSWQTNMMDLTSSAVAMNFLIIAYKDWCRKNKPMGTDTVAKKFQKNCFILWDKLIYEYVNKKWRGSSDSKIASNIISLKTMSDMFEPTSKSDWASLLNHIFESSKIAGDDINQQLMKPLLYHFYCLAGIAGPDTKYSIEVDHIIPKKIFEESSLPRKEVIKDNLHNLGLLPKDENASKNDKTLQEITSPWLKTQIEKYEFVKEEDYIKYSNLNNRDGLFKDHETRILKAYSDGREDILNN